MEKDTAVAIVKCDTYSEIEVKKSIEDVFKLAPLPEVEGKNILLKPNILSDQPPEKAVTTHPEIVKQVILYLKDKGAGTIYAGDSPGVPKPGFSGKKCGIAEAVLQSGALWADFAENKVHINNPSGRKHKEFKVTSFVKEVDMIISLPKLKTHQLMYFTGAVKNLFGLVPGLPKSTFHVKYPDRENFGEMLLDLMDAVKPSYALMDGIIGMEGPGPGNGTPHPVKVILGSTNLPALDIAASAIIGYDPMDIPTNRLALKRNYGLTRIEDVVIKGITIEECSVSDFTLIPHKKHRHLIFDLFKSSKLIQQYRLKRKPKPYFIEEKCIKCGECIKICASNANWFEEGPNGKFVAVDYNKCIRCYCCHEVCPVDAIEIK
ncbi:MAG: FeS-binding protein [Spirochaetes bacterium]|nr:MAG: FeS-binding protein [Spirochaetota bacterium]